MKKLLIVAYHYAPYAQVGAIRAIKFTKYFLKQGWDVDVLTVLGKYYDITTNDQLNDISGVRIIRTKRLPLISFGPKDVGFYWIPFVLVALKKILKKNKPDRVLVTGPPFYHWVILPLLKWYKVEYVLDIRDPWVLNPYWKRKKTIIHKFGIWGIKKIERYAVLNAKVVLNVTYPATRMYKDHYQSFSENKFITLPNGYDLDDFKGIKAKSISKFDIVYSGRFGVFRDHMPFLKAFKSYIELKKLTPDEIRFVWIGKKEENVVRDIERLNILDYVYMSGFVPYKENLSYIKGADICILVTGNHAYEPTTKIYDYMALEKRVLPIINAKGYLSVLFDELNIKYVPNEEDYILKLLLAKESIKKVPKMDIYNRKINAKKLERLMLACE